MGNLTEGKAVIKNADVILENISQKIAVQVQTEFREHKLDVNEHCGLTILALAGAFAKTVHAQSKLANVSFDKYKAHCMTALDLAFKGHKEGSLKSKWMK